MNLTTCKRIIKELQEEKAESWKKDELQNYDACQRAISTLLLIRKDLEKGGDNIRKYVA